MKHVRFGYTAGRRLTVTAPDRGMDVSSPPHRIRDDRASDLMNLHYRDGVLCTRPSLYEMASRATTATAFRYVPLGDHTAMISYRNGLLWVLLIREDGTLIHVDHGLSDVTSAYIVPSGSGNTGIALLYVDSPTVSAGIYAVSESGALTKQTPHVPTILSAAVPTTTMIRVGSGARLEPYNRLTGQCRCEYTPDGVGIYAWLPTDVNIPSNGTVAVTYTDRYGRTYAHTAAYTAGDVWVENAIGSDGLVLYYDPSVKAFWFAAPKGSGIIPMPIGNAPNSVRASITCTTNGREREILSLRFGTWYGGDSRGTRLFVSGSDNRLYWSALNDPLYFPEHNDAYVGDAGSPLTAFGKQDDALILFKSHELYALTYSDGEGSTADALLSGAVTDTEASDALFPITRLHASLGCDCPATIAVCGDRLTWLCRDGRVYALYSGGTYEARRVRALSAPIEAELAQFTDTERQNATAAATADGYRLCLGDVTYVLDTSHTAFASGANYITDRTAGEAMAWYRWHHTVPDATRYGVTAVRGRCFLCVTGTVFRVLAWDGDEGCDRVGGVTYPIENGVCTKWFDLGAAGARKQLQMLTVWVTGTAGEPLTVSFRGCDAPDVSVTLTGAPSQDATPYRIPLCGIRARLCGVSLRARGRLTVERYELRYRRMGEIRDE